MTDKEFIGFLNNLEDKSQHVCKINICNFKPYDPKPETERIDVTVADMIDLINRQQKELEELNVELVGIRGACNSYKMHYDNAQVEIEKYKNNCENCGTKTRMCIENLQNNIVEKQAEIERIQKLVDDTDKNCRTAINIIGRYERQFKTIKSEAIKEFAERLDRKFAFSSDTQCISAKTIRKFIQDELKEMVGEQG